MDHRVRKPQPVHLLPTELDQGVQFGWKPGAQEPPITRSGILRWALLGAFLTIMVMADITFAVSLFVVLTDPDARTSILTTLISAVFGLPATLLAVGLLHEKNRSRSTPGSPSRRNR